MMTIVTILLSALGGGGLAVAFVQVWGKIKLKQMDLFTEERKYFIGELNGLREQMNSLYKQHYDLQGENAQLKQLVQELNDHVTKKSLLINELTFYKGKCHQLDVILSDYKNHNDQLILISKLVELSNVLR